MKLKSQYAVISFCPDLTAADSRSVPVALLFLAEEKDRSLAAAAIGREVFDVDSITRAFLQDIPRLIKDHVEAAASSEGISTDDLLRDLHDSLRNSLHVSKISSAGEIDLDDDVPIESQFARILEATQNAFNQELEAAGLRRLVAFSMPRHEHPRGGPGAMDSAVPSAATIWKINGANRCGNGAVA